MAKKIIVGNWKMHPVTLEEARELAKKTAAVALRQKGVGVIVAPPFPFLWAVHDAAPKLTVAAQDIFWEKSGAYTGEISVGQMRACGASYAIIGHSERRMHLGETDVMVGKKVRAALAGGIRPIVCVGEREREGDDIPAMVGEQVRAALAGVKKPECTRLLIAYEPVWAISTNSDGRPDTPDDCLRATLFIRKIVAELFGHTTARALSILYGGSVRPDNIRGFVDRGGVQGALVGGASIDATVFAELIVAASHPSS